MSVCSETFLFQNLLWRVWKEIAEDDLCTYLLSTSSIYLDFFFSLLRVVCLGLLEEEWMSLHFQMRLAEVISPDAIWKMPRVHDKLSVTLIIHTDAEDCPWRMTVSAVLAVSVTNHQVIILLACKIASASMTTLSTHCISMRIKTVYIWRVQAEVLCAAESPREEIWEKYKIPKKGVGLIKTCYIKLFEV